MFFKEQFTTVTPLSKAFAAVLFITLPFVAFFIGVKYGQQSLPPVETIVVLTPTDTGISTPTRTATSTQQTLGDSYINPISIAIDESCLRSEIEEGNQKITVTCNQLNEAIVSPAVEIVLKSKHQIKTLTENDYEFDVYIEFYENSARLDVPPYYFPSYADANTGWFGLSISYLDKNNIYMSDSGGHEGYPSHYFFNGINWSTFSPWELIKDDFPDTIQPPFSVMVSPKYLKITEEEFCCDQVYSNTDDRKANRVAIIIDRPSKQAVQIIRIPR